jgi:high-affinity iron transporter
VTAARRLSLILLVLAGALVAPASTLADGDELAEARAENDRARELVDQSVATVEDGDRERGYELAREAYLDHFERVEIPLRLRDPNLVLDLEYEFAQLRDGIQAGDSKAEVEDQGLTVQRGLDDVERELTEKGIAAPLVALGFSFSILFREGLEAVLLIAILLGSLEAARAASYARPLAWGAVGAVAASAVTFVVATTLLDIAPVDRELLEAGTALLAVAVLFSVSFWLVSRLEQRRWMEFMRARTATAVSAGGALAFAGLGFTAVYREGFETVLFYQALLLFAEGLIVWVVLGAVLAAAALGGLGYAVFGLGRKLPLRPMLIGGASILLLLSVAFVGNAVRSLQEADVIGVTPIEDGWARLPIFIAELTGIHATREGIAAQAALLAVYVLGAVYVFGIRPVRQRRAIERGGKGSPEEAAT